MKRQRPWRSFPVPVAHVTYTVELYKDPPKADGERVQGFCDYKARRIGVWMNPNEEAMRCCYWHEWGHAFFYEIGMDELADNHSLVEGLAIAIMSARLKVPHL